MNPPTSWDLPDEIKKRFGQKSPGKQRAMVADGHLLLVLHKAPKSDQRERVGVFFWRTPEGKWYCDGWGEGLEMLWKHINTYNEAADQIDKAYEQAQTAQDYFAVLEELSPLNHAAQNLHATLQAAREGIPQDRDIIDLRDEAYELQRTLDLLYSDTKNALDFHIATKNEEQAQFSMQAAQTGHRLNVLAAIFFPLTAIASLFGMSLRSGLENAPIWVFWAIFVVGILVGLSIKNWVLQGTVET
ncbi:MAG: hypothetical protein JXA89_09910 [Anaerolineae bacterium]|nr:hypothetical protein [Anaerolineae bacterium]